MSRKSNRKPSARRRARLLALETLYQMDLRGSGGVDEARAHLAASQDEAPVREYARRLVDGVLGQHDRLDKVISASATNWQLDRLAVIDRVVLRMAVFEMFNVEDVPPRVAINEAIEVAKTYSTAESGQFVNGVLDQVRRQAGLEPGGPLP